ncbi:MAG: magnesium transporter, partial [Deinococcus sp.]
MLQYQEALSPAELLEVLESGDEREFKALLRSQPEPVVDAAFEVAGREGQVQFLRLMPVERAASTFTDLPLEVQAELLPDLPPDRLRLMGAFIGPDEVADLLSELGPGSPRRERLLAALPPTLARSAQELERYPDDDAGGLMTPEFVALRENVSVRQALDFLRRAADRAETVQKLLVVDDAGRLTGTLPLERLLTAQPDTTIAALARRDVIFARTDTDQEEVAHLMRDYDLTVLPVVDDSGVLRGIVTIDDVLDVVQEEA